MLVLGNLKFYDEFDFCVEFEFFDVIRTSSCDRPHIRGRRGPEEKRLLKKQIHVFSNYFVIFLNRLILSNEADVSRS